MVHNSYRDIIEESKLLEEENYLKGVNKQQHKQQVISAVRQRQLPAIFEQAGLDFHDLSQENKEAALHQYTEEDYKFRVLEALESISDNMEKLLTDFRLSNVRRANVFGNRFTITVVTGTLSPLIYIDFVNPNNCLNLPINLQTRYRPIPKMTIINEGPGNLLFAANEDAKDGKITAILPAVIGGSIAYTLDYHEPTLEYLNLQASGSSLTVNLLGEI